LCFRRKNFTFYGQKPLQRYAFDAYQSQLYQTERQPPSPPKRPGGYDLLLQEDKKKQFGRVERQKKRKGQAKRKSGETNKTMAFKQVDGLGDFFCAICDQNAVGALQERRVGFGD